MEQREHLRIVSRIATGAANMENNMEFPQKWKTEHFWVFPRKKQKHQFEKKYVPLCPLEHISVCYIPVHTQKYYSAIKKILSCVIKQMDLQSTVLNEISQTEKNK